MASSAIVSEVIKQLEVLPLNLQTQVLNFVRRLSSTRVNAHAGEDGTPSVAEVVARIKAMPPNSAMITQPKGSLADALRDAPSNPSFDLHEWQKEWESAENELKRINLEDDIAEGRL